MTEDTGLMRPILERNEAGEMMSALRKAFGPSRGETLTPEESLGTSLSDITPSSQHDYRGFK